MLPRYYVSKMIQLLVAREFAAELTKSTKPGKVVTSVTNPGFVQTEIMRHGSPLFQIYMKVMRKVLARSAEEGGRTLVLPAGGDESTHGKYFNDGKVAEWVSPAISCEERRLLMLQNRPSDWVLSDEGKQIQEQLWRELTEKLEATHPGIMKNL